MPPRKPKNYPDHPAQQPPMPQGYGMYGAPNMGGYDPNTGTYDPNMSSGYGVPPPAYSPMAPGKFTVHCTYYCTYYQLVGNVL